MKNSSKESFVSLEAAFAYIHSFILPRCFSTKDIQSFTSSLSSYLTAYAQSKIVDAKILFGRDEVMVGAVQFTAVLMKPQSVDFCRIMRDLKQLGEQRISLMKDTEAVSAEPGMSV